MEKFCEYIDEVLLIYRKTLVVHRLWLSFTDMLYEFMHSDLQFCPQHVKLLMPLIGIGEELES